jgi:hypothetical protein
MGSKLAAHAPARIQEMRHGSLTDRKDAKEFPLGLIA